MAVRVATGEPPAVCGEREGGDALSGGEEVGVQASAAKGEPDAGDRCSELISDEDPVGACVPGQAVWETADLQADATQGPVCSSRELHRAGRTTGAEAHGACP